MRNPRGLQRILVRKLSGLTWPSPFSSDQWPRRLSRNPDDAVSVVVAIQVINTTAAMMPELGPASPSTAQIMAVITHMSRDTGGGSAHSHLARWFAVLTRRFW